MTEQFSDIRQAVRALCAGFPGAYWRALDRDRAYPAAFVQALTEAGYLAALIPEDHGGSGLPLAAAAAILEEIHAAGCNGAACHAQMYTMGTILRHGSPAQKAQWLPGIASGALRLQAFGVTEPGSGTDTLNLSTTAVRRGDSYVINGQRKYNGAEGLVDKVSPGKGGAYEVVARYSSMDLNDITPIDPIKGGSAKNFTLGANWYPNTNFRVMLDWTLVNNDEYAKPKSAYGGIAGDDFSEYQIRLQFAF